MSYFEPDRSGRWLFVVGLLAGLLLLSIVWAVQVLLEPDEAPGSGAPSATTSSPGGGQATGSATPTVLETCRAVVAMQADSLRAGRPALDLWEVHIGAMNRLVTGVITFEDATAFWDDTRIRAKAHLDRFHAVQATYAARTARCPGPGSVGDRAAPVRCATAATARHLAVRTLVTALSTWDRHVRHMEMLRHGHLSPARAEELWLASWQTGMEEVREHHAARETARGLRCGD